MQISREVEMAFCHLQNCVTAKSGPGTPEPRPDGEHVAEGARQPVKFQDDEHIARAKMIKQPVKFGPIPPF